MNTINPGNSASDLFFTDRRSAIERMEDELREAQGKLCRARTAASRRHVRREVCRVRMDLAWEFLHCGAFKKAFDQLVRVPWRNSGQSKCIGMAWALDQGLGRSDEARRLLDAGLATHPDSAPLLLAMGNWHHVKGLFVQSLEYFERARLLDPHRPEYALSCANALYELTCYEDAAEIYRTLAREAEDCPGPDPNFAVMCRSQIGYCSLLCNRPEDAMASFQACLEVNPDFEDAYNGLFCAYHDRGMLTDAIDIARKGIRKFPVTDSRLYHNLAIAYLELDWTDDARGLLRKGLEIFPEDPHLTEFLKVLDEDGGDDGRNDKPTVLLLIRSHVDRRR